MEYKGYRINKNSRFYYIRILTDKGMITIKSETIEELKKELVKNLKINGTDADKQ